MVDGPAGGQYAVDSGGGNISCDLVLVPGYKVEPLDGVAFDEASSTVSTGRGEQWGVLDRIWSRCTRLYTPGGPSVGPLK